MIAIVKYNAGNIRSVVNALRRVGVEPVVTDSAAELRAAERVIFPGQGEAGTTMAYLRESGLGDIIRSLTQPVLGICIGQQLLCESSQEGGGTPCLSVYPGATVQHFRSLWQGAGEKTPHIGWNTIHSLRSPLFEGVSEGAYVYFIHSYCVPEAQWAIARTEYGGAEYSSAMQRGNFYATQFHPEKSGAVGERILHNFIHLCHD